MIEVDVLVIGAGPAGLAAAIEARRAGHAVEIIEQRETIGGAIYRQPISGVRPIPQAASGMARWRALEAEFKALSIPVRHGSVFLGIDGMGLAIIEDRKSRSIRTFAAKAVVLAVGAVEKVLPRPGWHLPGVATAGGLQVMMKETGRAPAGRILLAGNGPLLIAVAAQMARLGNPPCAIIEGGDPFRHPLAGLRLAAHPSVVAEALGYINTVRAHAIRWIRGASLVSIERRETRLSATMRDRHGGTESFTVDRVGLHDGIRPNDFGLPEQRLSGVQPPAILRVGDCREALGAEAAIADGCQAGGEIAKLLSGEEYRPSPRIARFRDVQGILGRMFAPVETDGSLADIPDETVLCRCENRTVGDLKALCDRADALTGREIKHNGRFAMGACQGRFCADNTALLMARFRADRPAAMPEDLTGRRWPARPVPISALIAGTQSDETNAQDDQSDCRGKT
jgi:NADPH-dependent 2,4-dienoyl-CoA reductase/sulfur reductase-like enzyme